MQRLTNVALLVLGGVAACGGSVDDRPRTLEYITKAVLAPSCASAECHSTFKQAGREPKNPGDPIIPLVFDTVTGSRNTFQRDDLLIDHFEPGDEIVPTLIINLTVESKTAVSKAPRMPLDAPLPQADLELIEDWIKLGGPGVCTGGIGSTVCHAGKVYACNEDRALSAPAFPPKSCHY